MGVFEMTRKCHERYVGARSIMRKVQISAVAMVVGLGWAMPGFAQSVTVSQDDLAAMRAQMEAMAQRITTLETQLEQSKGAQVSAPYAAEQIPANNSQAGTPPQLANGPTVAPAPAPGTGAAEPVKKVAKASGIKVRGYTQLRFNEIISGDKDAPSGQSRLRSVQDGSIGSDSNFSIRRLRVVMQGDLGYGVSFYLQPDFAVAVNNQSSGERRENYLQLRDAYVDVAATKELKFRFGQSKVPFGWENLQSSSNRIPFDRTDAINSAVPSERDLGIVAYYTPAKVQAVWDELEDEGQKLFGNYGAFGVGVFNGQGVNRRERNESVMTVAMGTYPFRLDGLGGMFEGQVLELGGSVMRNKVRPELSTGGVSDGNFTERRAGLHAILYPRPFGIQAEWNFGKAPQFNAGTGTIELAKATGGYVMAMYRIANFGEGTLIPYARWETYKGGWKAAADAPALNTNDFEVGVEWAPIKPLELTFTYARMKRVEADSKRFGQAKGDVLRAMLQWNY